jgi:hypothetical protein
MKKIVLFLLISMKAFSQGSVKISDMPPATSLTGTEIVPIVQAGINKKATVSLWPNNTIVVSSNTTAVNDAVYTVVASATFTDPSPVEGKGFTVFIRNGTGTVGGTGYSVAGTKITRIFHSGSWANYVGGGAISGLTSGRVVVATSGTTIGDDANLVWDAANKRLDLRTASRIRFQRNDNLLNFEIGVIDPIATNDFIINAVTSPPGFQFQQTGTTTFGITNLQRFNFNNKVFFNTTTGSALADFQSTNQGLVLPRALRSAITSSENGMLTVDTNVPYFNNGTAWSAIPTAPTALGTSLQVLRTNAGGTATEWATISAGGTYYAPSTLVANATDANFTATLNGVHNILDGVASANRVITIPTGANGDVMKFFNTEDTYIWSFTGATVYLEDRVTVETELRYNVSCFMEKIDGRWIITN